MDADTFAALMAEPARSAIHQAITLFDAGRSALEVSGTIRQQFPTLTAPVATAVIGQATLRRRGRAKFGAAADDLWFTPDGLEQATTDAAAQHRATRFAHLADELGRVPRAIARARLEEVRRFLRDEVRLDPRARCRRRVPATRGSRLQPDRRGTVDAPGRHLPRRTAPCYLHA